MKHFEYLWLAIGEWLAHVFRRDHTHIEERLAETVRESVGEAVQPVIDNQEGIKKQLTNTDRELRQIQATIDAIRLEKSNMVRKAHGSEPSRHSISH